jgi:alkyl hydroperoxide reductase subunit AhpC
MFSSIKIADQAPAFKLKGYFTNKEIEIQLEDLKGKSVVLVFYPSDFTEDTKAQLLFLNKKYADFTSHNIYVLACTIDSPVIHTAFVESIGGLDFPIVSDVHHTTCMDYNVYDEDNARSFHGMYIIDSEGILKWYTVSDRSIDIDFETIVQITSKGE